MGRERISVLVCGAASGASNCDRSGRVSGTNSENSGRRWWWYEYCVVVVAVVIEVVLWW